MYNISDTASTIELLAKNKFGSVNRMVEVSNGCLNKSVVDNMKREKPSVPNIIVFHKIAELLGVSMDFLLTGQEQAFALSPERQELLTLWDKLDPIKQAEFKGELKGYIKAKEEK